MISKQNTLIAASFGVAAVFSSLAPAQQQLSIVWEAFRNQPVFAVADIPGTGLVAVARYNKVQIRQWSTGALVRVIDPLATGTDEITARSLSANQNGLVAFGIDTTLYLADANTGRVIQGWEPPLSFVLDTALSPNGRYLAVSGNASGNNPRILIYDLEDLRTPPLGLSDSVLPVNRPIRTICFSPDSTQIFGAMDAPSGSPGVYRVWNVTGGDPLWRRTLATNGQYQYASEWNAGGLYAGTEFYSSNGRVYRLNPATGNNLNTPMVTTATTLAITTTNSGRVGAYGAVGHYGFSNDLSIGPVIYTNTVSGAIGGTYDIAGRPGFPQYAVATTNRFSIYQTQTPTTAGNPTELFTTFDPAAPGFWNPGFVINPRMVAWSPNGNLVATGPSTSDFVRIFNAATGALIHNVTLTLGDAVSSLAFNPDSTELAVGCFRSTPSAIRRINTATGTVVGSISIAGDTTPVSVQYTNDGLRIMACNGTADGRRIRIYNLDGTVWAQSPQLTSTSASFTSAVLSPDGTRIAATTQGTGERKLRLYNIAPPNINPDQETSDQNSDPLWCSWDPNNLVAVGFAYLAANGGSRVAVYGANNLSAAPIELGVVPNTTSLTSVTYSDGNVVATGLGIHFFNIDKQQRVAEFQGTEGIVNHVAFSPSGDRFAFVTENGRLAVAQSPATDNRQTLFFLEPATRLIVAWRLTGGNVVVLPTVTIDYHDVDWEPRAFGADALGANSNIYFQNTSSGPQARRLAYWTLANSGVPTGTGALLLTVEPNWVLRTAGDVNQDGVADLIWQNTSTNAVAVWFRGGNGAIVGTNLIGIGAAGWDVVGVGLWFPGNPRLVWYNPSSGQIVTWTLSPAGAPSNPQTIGYAVPASEWRLRGLGNLGNLVPFPILFFENVTTGALWAWAISDSTVIGSARINGTLPAGWRLIGVGQLNP
jgi:WD40 repeat protein